VIPSRRALVLLLVVAIALAAAFLPFSPGRIETAYSQGVYLSLQRQLTPLTNAAPVAVTDLLLAAAVLAVLAFLRQTWRVRGARGIWAAVVSAAAVALTATASVYLVFLATWGLNYRRVPLAARLDFDRSRVNQESVTRLARSLTARVNDLYAPAHRAGWPAWEDLPAQLGPSFEAVQRQLAPVKPAVAGVPKWSLLTFYFERAGVSGLTDPFALEVVVDRAQLPFERPFVAAHEWAHLAGYADESEANFIGWLVCFQGPPTAEYSGDLVLLTYVLGALPDAPRAELVRAIAAGPRQDLAEVRKRAALAWPWLQRPAWWVYDRYLRANRVEQGVMSYSAALQLLAGTRFEKRWVPVRK
jgi:hypothetical protein